jgi:hypothetical protein
MHVKTSLEIRKDQCVTGTVKPLLDRDREEANVKRRKQDARNTQVGVGVVRGDSRTFGKDRYWVVVIYTAPR